jgi:glycerol-3-phosphate dehydrogenase
MNVSLAMTAAAYGATIANYVEVTRLSVGADGKLDGVCVKNRIPNIDNKLEEFSIEARGVINATGPFTDSIRQMAKEQVEDIVAPSSGTHIVLPAHFGPSGLGLLDPATSDGRVLFFLPWLGHIIAGTTDEACDITKDPTPKGSEVDWILRETNRYMQSGIQIQRSDVLSAWTGIRPLVRDPSKAKSEGLVRNHLITKSGNGLITIAGGKWTTYRQMAEEAVDEAIADFGLASYASRDTTLPSICSPQELEPLLSPDGSCKTLNLKLIGAHGWDSNLHINLAQTYGLDSDVAMHLTTAYGDRAWQVASLCTSTFARCNGSRLTPRLPFIDGEIVHAIRSEYAQTVVDVVSRRMRLAFLDTKAALNVLPKIEDIMGQELGWSAERREMEHSNAIQYLKTMVSHVRSTPDPNSDTITGLGLDSGYCTG